MIKAVLFDIDGVLLDSFDANVKFYQDLLVLAGYQQPTREAFIPFFHVTMKDVIRTFTKSTSEEEITRIWEMGHRLSYPYGLLKIPVDAEETIKQLSNNYALGIVTSRIRGGIYKIPLLKKLQKLFHVTVAYEDTITHKPDPAPLFLACEKLHINPQDAVYIGDVENDILAAKAAGMKSILYSSDHVENADGYTTEFNKLPEIIESLT
jgi:HAD superfamily hydrolase (TIGR01549 family)